MKESIISESHSGLLYEDGVFIRELNPGKHEFKQSWFKGVKRSVKIVDRREQSLVIKGQEILTADKVAIRVSLLVYFKVTDAAAAIHHVVNYNDRIYEDVQLSARRYLASRDLEQILKARNEISDNVRDTVKGSAASYGVEIIRADVKDLVFPGNLREIMNQVLETERQAEAQLIRARKDAEARLLQAQSEKNAELERLAAEQERVRLKALAEQERQRIELQTKLERAKAMAANPELVRLEKLDVLKQLARSEKGRFVIGLDKDELGITASSDG